MDGLVHIDGSAGEGGGQVLRSSLALSVATGRPFRIERIRAGRSKPGLMRQHLTAVRAAQRISAATVEGDRAGSGELLFAPGPVRSGEYAFAVGTAGSTVLVLQAILPALLCADGPSVVRVEGGTHALAAPPFEHTAHALVPLLNRMGANVELELVRHGFFPAGGGEVVARVTPASAPRPLALLERGAPTATFGEVVCAGIGEDVGTREAATVARKLGWSPDQIEQVTAHDSPSPGNAIALMLGFEQVTEVVSRLGRPGLRAERVATDVAGAARQYLRHDAPVGPHLADQLMVPMALLAGGRFRTGKPTPHTRTNAGTIAAFLGDVVTVDEDDRGSATIAVAGRRKAD